MELEHLIKGESFGAHVGLPGQGLDQRPPRLPFGEALQADMYLPSSIS